MKTSKCLTDKLKCLCWRAENFFIYNHMTVTEMGYLLGENLYKDYQVKAPENKGKNYVLD